MGNEKVSLRRGRRTPQKVNEIIEAVFSRLLQEELQVTTSIKPSTISGLGLFAAEDIPKSAVVFRWNDQVDQEYPKKYPDRLPSKDKKDFMDMASEDEDGWFLAGDGASYFNHSEDPNVGPIGGPGSAAKRDRLALRDIAAGEELTMDYGSIGSDVP